VLSLSKVIGTIVAKELLYKTLTEVAKEIIISHYSLDTLRLYSNILDPVLYYNIYLGILRDISATDIPSKRIGSKMS
jgi:hypothetical protein